MASKAAFIASVAGNLVLATFAGYLLLGHTPSPESTSLTPQSPPVPVVAALAPTGNVDDEKVLTLARLEAAEAAGAPQATQFWNSDSDKQIRRHAEAIEGQRDRIRTALVARYGPSAAGDPAFSRVYKPLNSRYPYLSSKSQVGLLNLQQVPRALDTFRADADAHCEPGFRRVRRRRTAPARIRARGPDAAVAGRMHALDLIIPFYGIYP